MNTNLDMDWTENQGLSDSQLMNIASGCGYDITIGANNGEEIRRAYNTLLWLNDQEINGIDSASNNSDTHEYVDLGLPSEILWATENIKDANGNELFFAWGETQGYTAEQVGTAKNFTWEGEDNDYAFGPVDRDDQTNYGMKKYNKTDGLTVLEPGDDAATVNWGEGWKMPTKEQFEELIANTEYEETEIDGVRGAKFTSKVEGYTDRFLFFPAVGIAGVGEVVGVGGLGYYWSVSLHGGNVNNAWYFGFDDGSHGMNNGGRCYGCSVRPVRVSN